MRTEIRPKGALRLEPCNYGLSKVPFRGPARPTDDRFIAFIGGSDTFGKFIAKPFPDLVETAIGEICVNLGCQSAGPDVFLQDTAVQALCHDAAMTVIQIIGAVNQTNVYYKVHPRRNDRFIAPTDKLIALYPEIDFAEISFTGHLISRLRAVDEDRFVAVREELELTWIARMKFLIGQMSGPVLLLWLAKRSPDDLETDVDPAFVTREMIERLRGYATDIIEVNVGEDGTEEMCFAPLDALTAGAALGGQAHAAAAKAIRAPLLQGLS